jgi:GH3 auxin-responsive promoter
METAGRAAYRRLLAAAQDPRASQERTLRRILKSLRATEFGKKHGYDGLCTADGFRRAVPIHDYEALRPHVDRQIATGQPVLAPERPIMYARTSGTTGGPKLVPVTNGVARGLKRAQRAMAYVQHKAYHSFRGRILGIGGARCEDTLPDGSVVGSATGLIYETMPRLIRAKYVLPAEVFAIEDHDLKYAVMARLGAQCRDVTAVATANPSTILRLLQQIEADLPDIVEELAHGSSRLIARLPARLAPPISALLEPNPEQAKALAAMRHRGRLVLGDLWPGLRSVMTWVGGGCTVAAEAVRQLLPPAARMIDAGYVASEVRGTVVVDAERGLALPLLDDVFFEFAPVDGWTAGRRETLLLHELEDGEAYHVIVTTLAGLARYHMNDVVRVTGRIGRTPTLAFLRKGRGVTNITGEKLSEDQVNLAVAGLVNDAGISVPFYVVVADPAAARYRGYIELPDARPEFLSDLATRLDQKLRQLNIEYDSKRASNRLQPLRLVALSEGAERAYRRHCVAKGQREAQFKVLTLQNASEFDFDVTSLLIGDSCHASAPR